MSGEYTGERRGDSGSLRERLAQPRPLLLDGATGTELERRGIACDLPLWSTRALLEAPAAVREIHAAYAREGAELLTANTFRTQRYTLARAGMGERAGELTRLAVELARDATRASPGRAWVAGSAPPLEDCYRPDLVPDAATLEREHSHHCEMLAAAGADLLLLETLGSVREARAAARAAAATGLPFIVGCVVGASGALLSGERLSEAVDAVVSYAPDLVAINCVPPSLLGFLLPQLDQAARAHALSFGAYANLGAPGVDAGAAREEELAPVAFAGHFEAWLQAGARLLGGCCGTQPSHVAALRDLVHSRYDSR